MARLELGEYEQSIVAGEAASVDTFFQLGMMYSTGRSVPVDYVIAHKWLNIAALKGHSEAARHRSDMADFLSPAEIKIALKKARDWLSSQG